MGSIAGATVESHAEDGHEFFEFPMHVNISLQLFRAPLSFLGSMFLASREMNILLLLVYAGVVFLSALTSAAFNEQIEIR